MAWSNHSGTPRSGKVRNALAKTVKWLARKPKADIQAAYSLSRSSASYSVVFRGAKADPPRHQSPAGGIRGDLVDERQQHRTGAGAQLVEVELADEIPWD